MNQDLQVSLTIPPGRQAEVAREFRALATNRQWATLVAFAVAVVALEESLASGREVLAHFLPAGTEVR